MRRSLIIIAIVVVFIGLVVGGYFLFFTGGGKLSVAPSPTPSLPSSGDNPSVPVASSTDTTTTATATTSTPTANQVAARLVEIDKGPVVPGAVAFDIASTSATASSTGTAADVQINYLERTSGNIFSYLMNAATLTRISNRTVPGIQEAVWSPSGSVALVRYLSGSDNHTINTYALPSTGQGGFFLSQNITNVSVSSTTILTFASGTNGSIATIENWQGTKPAQAFSTPLSMARASLLGKSTYLVYTKASTNSPGYAFQAIGNNLSRVAGPLSGLVALGSPRGGYVLVSYSSAGIMKMELVNLKDNSTIQLPVATIADKCVWKADDSAVYCGIPLNPSASRQYPDDWYQGAVSFSDRIWKIDVVGRYAQLVLDFSKTANQELDATNLTIDPKSTVLVFRNKIDASLWAYQL